MFFDSVPFALFLPVVFLLYWFAAGKNLRNQNRLLLMASYFFYASWDWRFTFLLLFSTLLDYFTGIKISEATRQNVKKRWFWTSIVINLGFLGLFKYFNFFSESFASLISSFGLQANAFSLKVILPVGISFYTFHGLSYVIDIYHHKIKPEKDFSTYALFVSFFPLLVAGPIERATHLLPQIQKKRVFDYATGTDGLKQILWGLFKKIVVADQCAEYANLIFNYSDQYSGSTLLFGAFLFAFQIYGDFSGYSDMAIGTAKLFGIELLKNFSLPYFSRDIAEFWRRWHISLTSWFRDYLYIPLGGSRGSTWQKVRNTFIVFWVSGFWHGANWTFLAWGTLHAVYFLPLLLSGTNRNHLEIAGKDRKIPTLKEFLRIFSTFMLVTFAWIFFRSTDIQQAFDIFKEIFSRSLFSRPYFPLTLPRGAYWSELSVIFIAVSVLILTEWAGRKQPYPFALAAKQWKWYYRYALYYLIILAIINFSTKNQQFIYFQF